MLVISDSFSFGFLLSSAHGMDSGAGGRNREQVGRKMYQASAFPLAITKKQKKAEDTSRKTQVFPCWFLPETSCKTHLPRIIPAAHAVVFLCSA